MCIPRGNCSNGSVVLLGAKTSLRGASTTAQSFAVKARMITPTYNRSRCWGLSPPTAQHPTRGQRHPARSSARSWQRKVLLPPDIHSPHAGHARRLRRRQWSGRACVCEERLDVGYLYIALSGGSQKASLGQGCNFLGGWT